MIEACAMMGKVAAIRLKWLGYTWQIEPTGVTPCLHVAVVSHDSSSNSKSVAVSSDEQYVGFGLWVQHQPYIAGCPNPTLRVLCISSGAYHRAFPCRTSPRFEGVNGGN